jgi:SAM-dependent methyltransferase
LLSDDSLQQKYREFCAYQGDTFEKFIKKDSRILEIGAGYGWFVEIMKSKGYDVDGVEISDEKREMYKRRTGREMFGYNFLTDDVEELGISELYDCVAMFQTLEHITNPKLFITRAAKLLKQGGRIFIDVPNFNDWLKDISPEYNLFSYVRYHVAYYTPDTLKRLLEMCGFENICVYGHQYYSVENTIHWLRNKAPFREYHQLKLPEPLRWIDDFYKSRLENELKSNCIVAVAEKRGSLTHSLSVCCAVIIIWWLSTVRAMMKYEK